MSCSMTSTARSRAMACSSSAVRAVSSSVIPATGSPTPTSPPRSPITMPISRPAPHKGPRLRHDDQADLEPLLLTVGQAARPLPPAAAQADAVEGLLDAGL